jgi:four helix bundle protein
MMGRIQGDLKDRTFEFAVLIINLTDELPNVRKGWEVGRQLIRSGTSVGANVREADNASSDADFAHRCSIARKEAGETHYWLQLCARTEMLGGERLQDAIREADELARILSSVVKGTQEHIRREK